MIEVVVVAEASDDQEMACGLADRVALEEAPAWWDSEKLLNSQSLAGARHWKGMESGTSFTKWSQIKSLAQEANLGRYLGHCDRPAGADQAAGRKVVMLMLRIFPDQRHLLLVRDMDNQPEREKSLAAVRDEYAAKGVTITLALPRPNREAWLMAGYTAVDGSERSVHEEIKKELQFDPCLHIDRLSADTREAPKSAKRIFMKLVGKSGSRARECWLTAPLKQLRDRGRDVGLTTFLSEVAVGLCAKIRSEN